MKTDLRQSKYTEVDRKDLENGRKDSASHSRMAIVGLLAVYFLFNFFLLLRHEPWRDEANVWLMARELTPLQLFAEIKYQGHPCLWYLLVMPLAKLGLPFRSIGILSLLIMTGSAAVFLWKSRIAMPVKAVCLASTAFSYFYAVIARNYCLIPLFLLLLAWLYPERNEKSIRYGLLLGLLVQADTIAIVMAGMISLMWLCENGYQSIRERSLRPFWKISKGIWIPLASLFLWVAQFYQVSDSPEYHVRFGGGRELLREIKRYAFSIIQRLTGWQQGMILLLGLLLLVLLIWLSWKLNNAWAAVVMMVSFLFQAVFSAMVYELHILHFLSLFFVLIWMVWVLELQCREKQLSGGMVRKVQWGLQGVLLVLAVGMLLHWNSAEESSNLKNALSGCYSDGGGTAEYMKANISPEELIVSTDVPLDATILAHLKGYEFYYAGSGKKASYADWTEEQGQSITFEALCDWVQESFPEKKSFYLIWSKGCCLEEAEDLQECELLYQTRQETVRGEEYSVYRIDLGEKG